MNAPQPDIQPDVIRELKRTHWMVVPQFHRRINIFSAGHTLLKHAHRLESQGHAETTGSETGDISNHDWLLT